MIFFADLLLHVTVISVCKHIITRVLDISDYDIEKSRANFVMTLHQFMMYFTEEGGLKHVEDVAAESKYPFLPDKDLGLDQTKL